MRATKVYALVALIAFAVGCKKKPDTVPNGGNSDQERLQGVWAIESFEADPPGEGPDAEELKADRLQFDGERLTFININNGKVRNRLSYKLDTAADPKVMTLTELDDEGRDQRPQIVADKSRTPAKLEWLFKFDGDALVLAIMKGPGQRPTEFKPRAWAPVPDGTPPMVPVVIVKLKKTDEKPVDRIAENRPTSTPSRPRVTAK